MSAKFKDKAAPAPKAKSNLSRLRLLAVIFSIFGVGLFIYFVASIGVDKIIEGIGNFGMTGFAAIIFIYFLRILARAWAWKLSVSEPYELSLRETLSAVVIGEAMSSVIPLGILISGTSKAVAVRHRVPMVVGLSSIATENLFYSLVTGIFIVLGATVFLRSFQASESWVWMLDLLIGATILLIIFILLMIVRRWHFLSEICESLYKRGFLTGILENGRAQVRIFEDFIYEFYRKYPRRFPAITAAQIFYHLLGVFEVWFILNRLHEDSAGLYTAFLLETVSRIITIVFKLVPFLIGVDEAGAQLVTDSLALDEGLGGTIAIIRKGRMLFWAIAGIALIFKRGLTMKEIFRHADTAPAEHFTPVSENSN